MMISRQTLLSLVALFVAFGMTACSSVNQENRETYTLGKDLSYQLTFKGFKKSGSFESGGFRRFTAQTTLVDGQPEGGSLEVTIDTGSVRTPNGGLTSHLKKSEFFNVAKFPTAKFVSTRIGAAQRLGTYRIEGDLTMRGVTRPVVFIAAIMIKDGVVTFSSDFTLNQFGFGMTYVGRPSDPIRDGVKVHVAVRGKLVPVER